MFVIIFPVHHAATTVESIGVISETGQRRFWSWIPPAAAIFDQFLSVIVES